MMRVMRDGQLEFAGNRRESRRQQVHQLRARRSCPAAHTAPTTMISAVATRFDQPRGFLLAALG